mgnify:CR=1 FL=1
MRKVLAVLAVVALVLAIAVPAPAEDGDLEYLVKDKDVVKVFVKDFTNESGQAQVSSADFKKELEKALTLRKAVKFEIVSNPEASDFQIGGVIKNYMYSKTDPITPTTSPAALVLDAATTENYVEMTVDFEVVQTKNGKAVWQEDVKSYLKHTMTPEEALPMIYDKEARTFLWKSFGKPNR